MRTSTYPVIAKQFAEAQAAAGNINSNGLTNIGKYKYPESRHSVKTDVSALGVGTHKILSSDILKQTGICTIDRGKLGSNENLVLTGLVLGFANEADTNSPNTVTYSTVETNLDPALANGTIFIKQEGRVILELPIDQHFHSAASDKPRAEQGWQYDSLRWVKADTEFTVELELSSAVVPGANKKTFFYIGFSGWTTQL